MAVRSFVASALTISAVVHGAALPQNDQTNAPSCLNKAEGTTFVWSPPSEKANDGFEVTCGKDFWGGDLRSLQTDTFKGCLEACQAESACVSVAYGGTSCYLKNQLTPATSNGGVWSAKKRDVQKGLTCDSNGSSDGKTYTSSKGDFKIVCGKDYAGNDLPSTSAKSFEACIETCATTERCVDVSYVNGACYLKHTVANALDAPQVWTAIRVNAQPFVYGLTCENNKDDKKTYKAKSGGSYEIVCGTDYYGGDLSSLRTDTFEACMDACDSTTGCIDVSYSSGTCYLKDVLNTASVASWVWTGRKVVVTEKPLDLTQTEIHSVKYPAWTKVTKETNLLTQTLTGDDRSYGISTVLRFPTTPYTVYEVSFEYYQENTQGQSYFLEVGDSRGFLATLGWSQDAVGSTVGADPWYEVALGGTQTGRQLNTCWRNKSQPKSAPASGSWQSGSVVLYSRTTQGYFRRDNYGLGTTQWRNVYVREKTKDYCGITQ